MASFRIPFAPWLGAGWNSAFRDANLTDAQFKNVNPGPGGGPGAVFPWEGNLYQIVRNRTGGALAEGDLVKLYFNAATRVGTASAGTLDGITTTQNFAAGDIIDGSVPTYMFIRAGTQVGQRRRVRKYVAGANSIVYIALYDRSLNQASTATAEKFTATADATTQYALVMPWEMTKSAAVTDYITGVALATVADTNWTIIEVAGFSLGTFAGAVDALTAGGTVVPAAVAGQGKGPTTAAETIAEARLSFGMALDAYSGAAALRHFIMKSPLGLTYNPSTS